MSFSGLFQNSFLVQRLLISNARFCIDLPRFAGEAKAELSHNPNTPSYFCLNSQGLDVFLQGIQSKPKVFEQMVELKRADMEASPQIHQNGVFMLLNELRPSAPCVFWNEVFSAKQCHRQMISI